MYLLLENEDPNYQIIVQVWHSGIHFFFNLSISNLFPHYLWLDFTLSLIDNT